MIQDAECRNTVATLWMGPELSFLERLCFRSFAAVGQRVTLYLYDELEDIPDEVDVRDAREIMDEAFVQQHWGKDRLQDPRIHADIFRIFLLRKTKHIWVDTDVFAIKPHQTETGYLFAARKHGFVPNHVVALPTDSPALCEIEAFVSATGQIPPWWPDEKRTGYLADHETASFETLPVGVTGPEAFGHFLSLSGEMIHAAPFQDTNPIMARHATQMLGTPTTFDLEGILANSLSIHYYATGLRRRLFKSGGLPLEGSFIDLLSKYVDLDPKRYPVSHRDDKASVARFRKYNRPTAT